MRLAKPMDHVRIYRQMGSAIRDRRKKLALTQHKLAASVGMSRAAVANIETGRQNVFVHQLYALASALELRPHELLPLPADPGSAVSVHLPLPHGLKPEQRDQIVHLLTGIWLDDSPKKGGSS